MNLNDLKSLDGTLSTLADDIQAEIDSALRELNRIIEDVEAEDELERIEPLETPIYSERLRVVFSAPHDMEGRWAEVRIYPGFVNRESDPRMEIVIKGGMVDLIRLLDFLHLGNKPEDE